MSRQRDISPPGRDLTMARARSSKIELFDLR
jgi:hypothetical protein